jgi:hypothetical protein
MQAVEAARLEMQADWVELSRHIAEHACLQRSEAPAVATPDAILVVTGERRFVALTKQPRRSLG